MKKIVAIMAVSLMLFTSCGQIKGLVGLNKGSEGSGNIGSKLPTPHTPVAEKTFWGKYGEILGITAAFVVPFCTYLGIKNCCCGKKTEVPQKHPDPQAAPPAENHGNPQEETDIPLGGGPGAPADPAVGGADPLAGATDE